MSEIFDKLLAIKGQPEQLSIALYGSEMASEASQRLSTAEALKSTDTSIETLREASEPQKMAFKAATPPPTESIFTEARLQRILKAWSEESEAEALRLLLLLVAAETGSSWKQADNLRKRLSDSLKAAGAAGDTDKAGELFTMAAAELPLLYDGGSSLEKLLALVTYSSLEASYEQGQRHKGELF